MNKKYPKYFFAGIFILLVILGMWFVMATLTGVTLQNPAANENISSTYTFNATISGTSADNVTFYYNNGTDWVSICTNDTTGGGSFTCTYDTLNIPDNETYTFNATAINGTGTTESDISTGVLVDNTAPNVSAINNPTDNGNYSGTSLTLNASVNDSLIGMDAVYFNVSNSSGEQQTVSTTQDGLFWNGSLNLSSLADGNYNVTVYANDALNNTNSSEYVTITVDNTAPSVSASCNEINKGDDVDCSCSKSDATSGVNTTSTSDKGSDETTSLGFTFTCTVTDYAGNSASSTTTYTVNQISSGGSGGSSIPISKSHSWAKITPGVAQVMKNFDSDVGVKQIQIEVKNEAQNVKVTVKKYDGKPAEVSVEKSGKVHRYLQIQTQNLEQELEKATIRTQIEKSWVSDNNLEKENIALFKFDESAEEWNELTTNYVEEDDDYNYYDTELDSFSYFALGEKSVDAETGEGEEVPVGEEERNLTWLWIIIAVVIIAAIVGGAAAKKKSSGQ